MDLRHLRYVVAIAEERHFTRAAERLGIGQPPLSQQIKALEGELGVRLFHRLPRGVELTAAGEAFVPIARSALALAAKAVEAARRAASGEIGSLTIGFTGSASFNPLVPRAISRFRNAYPELSITLVEATTSKLLTALADGRIDVAFLRPAAGEVTGLAVRPLPNEPLCIAMPSQHRLASCAEIELGQLAAEPFILYPRENGRSLYDSIIVACQNAGFSPDVVQEAPQLASTINLVAAGVGVAMVPTSMQQILAPGVRYLRITGRSPSAHLAVAHCRNPKSPAVANFMRNISASIAKASVMDDDLKR